MLELPDAMAVVLEFVHGRDLASLLDATEVSPGMAVHMGLDLCSALAAAHARDLVHGDLKPGNILVTRDGHLKLLDFGLAHRRGTHGGNTAANALSVSPEQLRGEPVDPRADLFALGCLLYRLLDGAYPFSVGGGDWQHQRLQHEPALPGGADADWPQELSDLVLALLAKRPQDRPASALVVRQRLLGMSREMPAGDAAALARVASQVDKARRSSRLSGYGPVPEGAQTTPMTLRRVGVVVGAVALALLMLALYPGRWGESVRYVRIDGVSISGSPGLSTARLRALLGEAVAADEDLRLVNQGSAMLVTLQVNCASEVCSSQLLGRMGTREATDTRSLLVGESELAWQRRLQQGLAQLAVALRR